ncbi:GhoT/OrtT family toxin [Escherichia coli]
MALFSKILIFYVIGVNISFVIIWFISHEKTHIRLLSAFLVGITWPMSLPVNCFSLLGAVVEWTRWLS